MWSSIGEGVGLFVAAQTVISLGHREMLLPAMALVVGLHFLPMAYAIPSGLFTASALPCWPRRRPGSRWVGRRVGRSRALLGRSPSGSRLCWPCAGTCRQNPPCRKAGRSAPAPSGRSRFSLSSRRCATSATSSSSPAPASRAESGLATFRGPDGLWEGHRVEDVATPEAFAAIRSWSSGSTTRGGPIWRRSSRTPRTGAGAARRRMAGRAADRHPEHRRSARARRREAAAAHARRAEIGLVHAPATRAIAWAGAMRRRAGLPRCGARALRPDIVWFGEMPYRDGRDRRRARGRRPVRLDRHLGRRLSRGRLRPDRALCGARTLEMNLEPSLGSLSVRREPARSGGRAGAAMGGGDARMIEGSCHCGAVRLQPSGGPGRPRRLQLLACAAASADCGAIIGRTRSSSHDPDGRLVGYVQGDATLTSWHCAQCGCTTHWSPRDPALERMGVNLRLFDPAIWETLPRRLDRRRELVGHSDRRQPSPNPGTKKKNSHPNLLPRAGEGARRAGLFKSLSRLRKRAG